MRPLRPAIDHCLGGPLPHQLANRPRPPLQATCAFDPRHLRHGCYAVLAPVSRGYSPLEGRLVTCYSPGRHFTHGLLHFLVRLACVRHAASVDSEPGSNSYVKFVGPLQVRLKLDTAYEHNSLTRGPIDWLCVVQSVVSDGRRQPPSSGLTTPVGFSIRGPYPGSILRRHPLTLIV